MTAAGGGGGCKNQGQRKSERCSDESEFSLQSFLGGESTKRSSRDMMILRKKFMFSAAAMLDQTVRASTICSRWLRSSMPRHLQTIPIVCVERARQKMLAQTTTTQADVAADGVVHRNVIVVTFERDPDDAADIICADDESTLEVHSSKV